MGRKARGWAGRQVVTPRRKRKMDVTVMGRILDDNVIGIGDVPYMYVCGRRVCVGFAVCLICSSSV